MKITIDTKEDSHQDIRKVIAMLSKLIEGSEHHHSNIFEDGTPVLGGISDPETSSEPNQEPAQPTNAFASMFGGDIAPSSPAVTEEKKEEKPEPKIEIFEY